jgi:hypothetical protein
VLTIVSVNVVQHIRHWHAIKIAHVKIALAVPSLSLQAGEGANDFGRSRLCCQRGVILSAGGPVHVLRWTTR